MIELPDPYERIHVQRTVCDDGAVIVSLLWNHRESILPDHVAHEIGFDVPNVTSLSWAACCIYIPGDILVVIMEDFSNGGL